MNLSYAQYIIYFTYLLTAMVMTLIFTVIYERITPQRELPLIKNGNVACALSFGGALMGFCIALVSAMTHSVNLPDFILWCICAGIVQIGLFFAVMKIIPDTVAELEANNVAVGTFLCMLSIAIGLLNAACLVG